MLRILNIGIQIIRIPLGILYLSLLLIHFIVKDRFRGISFLFYACPLPLIIIFGLLVLIMYYNKKFVRSGLITIMLGTIVYFGFHYFGTVNDNVTTAHKSHILFWNASKNKPLTTSFLMDHIKKSNPEIIALVEAEDVSDDDLNILKDDFPEYEFKALNGTMLIGVKGTIESIWFQSLEDVCKFNYIKATIHQKPMTIMISDVYAGPTKNRKIPLSIIHDFISQNNPVDVLLGDFNTPYESAFFKPFKTDYKSFHPYSVGMTSTWPLPFPVTEIDHIWLAQKYNPIQLQKFCSSLSRHKMLIAEYQ